MQHIAYIGIGSNLGEKILLCEKAISATLRVDRNRLLARSSFFKTRPLGYPWQNWFVNAVIKIETELDPFNLLEELKRIEKELGRVETFRFGPRKIDLDILFFDQTEIKSRDLEIPHPRLHERQFVLFPLVEIEPELVHPILKKTVSDLLAELKEDQGVERLHIESLLR